MPPSCKALSLQPPSTTAQPVVVRPRQTAALHLPITGIRPFGRSCRRVFPYLLGKIMIVTFDIANSPRYTQGRAFGPPTAAPLEVLGLPAVQCQCEEVMRLRKICQEPSMKQDVDEAEHVNQKHECQDNVENTLPGIHMARGELLRGDGGIELVDSTRLAYHIARLKILPVVDERSIYRAHNKGRACKHSQGFCHRRQVGR